MQVISCYLARACESVYRYILVFKSIQVVTLIL